MNELFRKHLTEGERAGMQYSLVVPRESASGLVGFDMGRKAGSSLDFKDYREYQPGDDLRHIDWHAYARTDRLSVKLYREEVSPHVDIIIDGSRSMALENSAKARATLGLAAVFAMAAANAKCTHCAWIASQTFRRVIGGHERPTLWDGIDFDYGGNPMEAFFAPPGWRRNGIRVFISDLLWPGEPLGVLQRLSEGSAAVIVVQLLAKADIEPPPPGSTSLIDVENDGLLELFIDTVTRTRYSKALSDHQQNWHRFCTQTGAFMATIEAEKVTEDWRLGPLEEAQILGIA